MMKTNSEPAIIDAIAQIPWPQCNAKMINTASITQRYVLNCLARSIRCPPITIASYAAPAFAITIVIANIAIDRAAEVRNPGGTPACCASCWE